MNPIKYTLDTETIEEFCARNSFTDYFCVDNTWWAFPPHAFMPMPIMVGIRQHLKWDENYPASTPFQLEEIWFLEQALIPWKYRRVWSSQMRMSVICVRTDVYPLFWVYWWFYFRFKETLSLTIKWFIYVLEVWGLAELRQGQYASWRDIKILAWMSKVNALKKV
ncbi:hypothetical protein [Nostoc sp.]